MYVKEARDVLHNELENKTAPEAPFSERQRPDFLELAVLDFLSCLLTNPTGPFLYFCISSSHLCNLINMLFENAK